MKSKKGAVMLLDEIHHLMSLRGENPFKLRAFEKARLYLESDDAPSDDEFLERAHSGTLAELPHIGKGISEVLCIYWVEGKTPLLDSLKAAIPQGLIELTAIPGLGPKRALQLIETLEVHSVAELEYACRENRLLQIKGFGEKAQNKILEGIHLLQSTQGQMTLSDAFEHADAILALLLEGVKKWREKSGLGNQTQLRISEAGPLRRRLEVLAALDFLVEVPDGVSPQAVSKTLEEVLQSYQNQNKLKIPVNLHFSTSIGFGRELARLTGSSEHWRKLEESLLESRPLAERQAQTEEDFYRAIDLCWIAPEMRESGEEISLAKKGNLGRVLSWQGVQGIFHTHTTRSDGRATLHQMVSAAKQLGYKYIGISDHSQSAFYAQGLKAEQLLEQKKEIQEVQSMHPEIRIFWGIESDILADGSLDYDSEVLEQFDFVIASIHSRFQMDREAMTQRVLKAIRNPHTRFLGHATGRILLGRKGYDLDMEKVIEEAARCDVAIEINANPARLDIDWRWGPVLRKWQTKVSINPDAHDLDGLQDVKYGVAVARKALIDQSRVINAQEIKDVEKWLYRR